MEMTKLLIMKRIIIIDGNPSIRTARAVQYGAGDISIIL
jgi:hypothetical protein